MLQNVDAVRCARLAFSCACIRILEIPWPTLLRNSGRTWPYREPRVYLWGRTEDDAAKVMLLSTHFSNAPLGYDIVFNIPLSKVQITEAAETLGWQESPPSDDDSDPSEAQGRHYSWAEAWRLLWVWKQKRLG